jgi:phosphoribosylglycinamide formyltransferase-1
MINLVVLISGQGSNLAAILKSISDQQLNARVLAVISDQPQAPGLSIAQAHHIPTHVLVQQIDIRNMLTHYQPDWIILAGFMRILSSVVLDAFPNRFLNIHPSLLPQYPGLNTHQKVIAHQERYHGCTIHLVTPQLDQGDIIGHAKITLEPDDNCHTLKKKVQILEHRIYPLVLQWIADQKLRFTQQGWMLNGHPLPKSGIPLLPTGGV